MPLRPEIRFWSDRIYYSDPNRYQKLIIWIKAAERYYSPRVIAETLKTFYPHREVAGANWWGYLDKILDKTEGRLNASHTEAESDEHKQAEKAYLDSLRNLPRR